MSLYKNRDATGVIQTLEILPEGEGSLVFITIEAKQLEAFQRNMQRLNASFTPITKLQQDQSNIIILRSDLSIERALEQFTSLGEKFAEVVRPKKPDPSSVFDMNRMRGILGTAGQMFIWSAGKLEKNKALSNSSSISLASNLITVAYGTPNRLDRQKTEAMRHQADEVLSRHLPSYQAPDEAEVIKPRHVGSSLSKLNRFVGANNVYISDGMKFASQLGITGWGNNWVDRTMGTFQASAKVITFSGIDEDKDTPNHKKSWLTWFRENTNPFSGALEWAGQFMNMLNAIYLPQVHNVDFGALKYEVFGTGKGDGKGIKAVEKYYRAPSVVFSAANWKDFKFSDIRILSPMRFVGVCLFLSGFGAKIVAPFSRKDVDWGELHHHAALALRSMPQEAVPHLMGELSQLYLKAANNPELSFGEVYQSLKADLEKEWGAAAGVIPAGSEKPVKGKHTAALMAQQAERSSAPEAHTALQ